MDKYLSKNKLLTKLSNVNFRIMIKHPEMYENVIEPIIKGIYEAIKSEEGIDISGMQKGLWVRAHEYVGSEDVKVKIPVWKCSACHGIFTVDISRYKFCPGCGARMKNTKDDDG